MNEMQKPSFIDSSAEYIHDSNNSPMLLVDGRLVVKESRPISYSLNGKRNYKTDCLEASASQDQLRRYGIRIVPHQYVIGESLKDSRPALFVVSEYIDGPTLEQAVATGDQDVLAVADYLTGQFINILDDATTNGVILDRELIGYWQYIYSSSDCEAVLIDVEPSAPMQIDSSSYKYNKSDTFIILDYLMECINQVGALEVSGLAEPHSKQRLSDVCHQIRPHLKDEYVKSAIEMLQDVEEWGMPSDLFDGWILPADQGC